MKTKTRNFMELYQAMQDKKKNLCAGLDIDPQQIPLSFRRYYHTEAAAMYGYGVHMVEETADVVGAYKPNFAFYEARGSHGLECLEGMMEFIRTYAPSVPIILDRKAGDID